MKRSTPVQWQEETKDSKVDVGMLPVPSKLYKLNQTEDTEENDKLNTFKDTLSVYKDHDYCKNEMFLPAKYHSLNRRNKNDTTYCCSPWIQETEYMHLHQTCEKTKHQNSQIVAKKNLTAGQIICKENPVMRIHDIRKYLDKTQPQLFNKTKLPCVGCTANWTSYKCSKCCLPLCSRFCELSFNHKSGECSAIQKYNITMNIEMKSTPLTVFCYLLDVYVTRVLMSKLTKKDQLHRIIIKLFGHSQVKKALSSENFSYIFSDFLKYEKLCYAIEKDTELIKRIACVIYTMPCNPSKYPLTMDVLFPMFSWMTHSCCPNTEFWIAGQEDDFEIRVISSTNIDVNEPITVDMWSLNLFGTEKRAEFLKTKFIECECQMCKDPEECGSKKSGLLCTRCKTEYYFPIDINELLSTPWGCKGCHHTITRDVVGRLLDKANKVVGNFLISSPRILDMKTVNHTRSYLLRILHPQHSILLQLYKKVFDYYVREFWRKRVIDNKVMSRIQACIQHLEPLDAAKSDYLVDHACYKFFNVVSDYCLEKAKAEASAPKEEFAQWPNYRNIPQRMESYVKQLKNATNLLDLLDIPLYYDYVDTGKELQKILKDTLVKIEAMNKNSLVVSRK